MIGTDTTTAGAGHQVRGDRSSRPLPILLVYPFLQKHFAKGHADRQREGMTIHLAGDSTVAECPPEEFPMSGWGAALAEFVDEPVMNLAKGGATTESFVVEGLWQRLLAGVRPDDTVIVQFGHNDQKEPTLDAAGGYRDRLTGFVADIRNHGAHPVLATSPERRRFAGDVVLSTHGPYPRAVRELGASLDVPVIDLTAFTRWSYGWLAEQRSVELFTHLDPGQSAHWPRARG